MRTRKIPLLVVIGLLAAACGGSNGNASDTTAAPGATTPSGTEVTIRTTEFTFLPEDIEVPAGVPVTLVIVNEGVVEHDFTIEEIDLHVLIQPGETKRETVTFTAGRYDVHCTVPGHHAAGMTGTLVAS